MGANKQWISIWVEGVFDMTLHPPEEYRDSYLCQNPNYPEHNGQYCECLGCDPDKCDCAKDGLTCDDCTGPMPEGICGWARGEWDGMTMEEILDIIDKNIMDEREVV